jgi:hypothetical protein
MKRVCLARYRHSTRIGLTLNNFKEGDGNCWYRKYLRVSRDFFNEDFEQANREARDVIDEMNNKKTNNIRLLVDFYLIGIDASIKGGNPDEELLMQANRIATNDLAIMLRRLMMKIYNFEISRTNDIRVKDTIDEIEGIRIEAEEKIQEKFK